jgi:hypothetical protein
VERPPRQQIDDLIDVERSVAILADSWRATHERAAPTHAEQSPLDDQRRARPVDRDRRRAEHD